LIRVLLVEDHAAFRQALAIVLDRTEGLQVVGQAGSLQEARHHVQGVDVAVIDLDLPDGNGLDIVPLLRGASPRASVLVLTGSRDRVSVARAVEAGASGVLHKTVRVDQIVDTIRALGSGEALFTPQELVDLLRFATQQRVEQESARRALARLTPREMDVLRALGEGLSDKEIGERLHVSIDTVRTHMVNILGKLGVDSRLQALIFAIRHGIVQIA
jgi:DNA-binding NarL/FixJ family response regulator